MNRQQRRAWVRAVMKDSGLPSDAKPLVNAIAASTDENGTIRDPDIIAMLREIDREREAELS